jgi:hypothetical protein
MKARCGAGFFAESTPSSREAGGTRGLARQETGIQRLVQRKGIGDGSLPASIWGPGAGVGPAPGEVERSSVPHR